MKTNVRIGMAWLALLLGSLPLLAQNSSRLQQELIDPTVIKVARPPSASEVKSVARPAQPLPPAHSISRSNAGARINAATVETFNYSGAIVLWTVPANVTSITIEALGAEGGNGTSSEFRSGKGASITGTVAVTPGTQLKILVGQQGANNGGGGGTFITDNANNPLVIAGGGGGSGNGNDSPNKEGQAGTSGGNGVNLGHSGGTNGNGGGQNGTNVFVLASGGGLLTNGGNSTLSNYNGGQAFVNGGAGGTAINGSNGGFGGGGAGSFYFTGGGGGGYSGGGGAGSDGGAGGVGGGGGSFNGGTNQTNTAGANSGNGLVTITYNPCSPADASFTGLSGSYCADAAAVTLTPTTPGGTFSGPGVSGNTFTPANAGTGGMVTYTITVDGCPNSSTSQSVTVKPVPNASFTGLAGPYCANAAAVTLTPTTPGGTFSGPGVSGNTFTPANAGTGGTIMYTIVVDGCSNSSSQSVTVKPVPNASFTGLAGPYCADAAAVTLTPTTPGGTFSGPGVSGNTFTPANAGTGGTIMYTIVVDGCSNSSSQSVTVKPVPNASFTGLAGPYCANAAAVTLTPTTPGGTFSGPGVSGNTFTPANAGTGGTIMYTIVVDGCSNSSSQSVTVRPAISLTTSPNTTVVYGYGSNCTTLTASASGGTGNIGLSWSTGATGGSVQVCPTQTTTYYVTATDAAGCSVQKAITVTVNDVRCGYGGVKMCQNGREACIAQYLVPTYLRFGYSLGSCNTSVSTRIGYEPQENTVPSLALSLQAYPNPTSGALNVEVYSPVATAARFEVLDAAGRPVQQRAVELSEGLNPATFELKAQPAGNYLIRCVDALGRQATVRVNKQ